MASTPVSASDKDQTQAPHHLPDLGAPVDHTTLQPNIDAQGAGLTYHDTIDNKQFSLVPQYTKLNGLVVNSGMAVPLSEDMAMGFLLTAGSTKNEWLINTGLNMSEHQRVIFTLGQLRQKLDFAFTSGTQKAQMTQDNGALSYQYFLGRDWINATELNAYTSNTSSISLGDKTYYTDTSTLYELWNDPRRIAGARVSGVQSKLVLTPTTSTNLKLGFGGERLTYDYLSGKSTTTRATGSTELSQRLNDDVSLRATAITAAAQNRYSAGVANRFAGGSLGLDVITIRGRDGTFNDNQLLLNYTHNFGGTPNSVAAPALGAHHSSATDPAVANEQPANTQSLSSKPTWASPLLDQVALRPSFLPAQVVAKVDATVTQTRLIAIDKTALPTGSSVALATGILTAPIGNAVSAIAGVTLGGAPFTNTGQFALSGTANLVINPNLITQPATTDIYVVTMSNTSGGGTTLATVTVTHGSIRITSVVMSSGTTVINTAAILGVTAPVAGATPVTSVTGTGYTGTVTWSGSPTTFAVSTTYTATITLTPATGYTLTGVTANYFTVSGAAPVANSANAGVVSATFPATLPSGYIVSGGLTWAPINTQNTWANAAAACTASTALGYAAGSWRQPTYSELVALYNNRGNITPYPPTGWLLSNTWSSTWNSNYLNHYNVGIYNGGGAVAFANADDLYGNVSCVH